MMERHKTEVARLVCDGRWKLKHLKSFQAQFGDRALFDALYEPFDSTSESEYTFNDQQIAGTLLLELQPKCALGAKEVIERSLHQWNRSVEELPFYLARCFGRDTVLTVVDEIQHDPQLDDQAIEELETYRFWLRSKAFEAKHQDAYLER